VTPSNKRMNLPGQSVTRLAGLQFHRLSNGKEQGARPPRPVGYARRYASLVVSGERPS